jgi:F-type H+-transporting ATPase subunit gamma
MPSLKEYKAKIASLSNTRKITKTMKMVAASKLNRAMDAERRARAFTERLYATIRRLASAVDATSHPLLAQRDPPRNILVLTVMSDKGLCGGFNNGLIRFVQRWMANPSHAGVQFQMSFIGRRGYAYFRKRAPARTYYDGLAGHPTAAGVRRVANDLTKAFVAGEFDEIYVAYNHFVNQLTQRPRLEKILPIEPAELKSGAEDTLNPMMIFEPSEEELLSLLLPKTIELEIYYVLCENAAGENGARMTAMDAATRNATQMIQLFTLKRNRARQASITKELIEIISGAEALKG